MKILLIIHGFPPRQAAGSEIYTWMLANKLSQRDDVTVLTRTIDSSVEEYAAAIERVEKFNVISINNTLKYRKSFSDKYVNHHIGAIFSKILSEQKPDIVHIGHLIGLSTTIIDEIKKLNIPIVYTLHDFWLICPTGRFIKEPSTVCHAPSVLECKKCLAPQLLVNRGSNRLIRHVKKVTGKYRIAQRAYGHLEKLYKYYSAIGIRHSKPQLDGEIIKRRERMRRIFELVDCFIAPSKFLLRKYTSLGLPENKAIHLDYGFHTEPFIEIKHKKSEKLRLGYIGTLIPPKGVHVLLGAFSKIKSPRVELRIHGAFDEQNDEYRSYSNRLKELLHQNNVIWHGAYENQMLNRILCEIDLLIVPSVWYENSPLVIHEAFMAQVPVITSNAGGMAELVQHGVNGFLFEMGNENDLMRYIQRIIDQPDLLDSFRSKLPKVTDIGDHVNDIREIYRNINTILSN
jgi:glycosyltransferase involved in cell wall biosynthesis